MSRKTVLVSRRKYLVPRIEGSYLCLERQNWFLGCPKGVTRVSKDSIGFPKEIFRYPKGVSQIRIRVRQMMYVDQFEVFRCPNRSNMAAQRSQTSGFSVGFSGGNSEQTVKQLIEVFSRKHRAHCLKATAVPRCRGR